MIFSKSNLNGTKPQLDDSYTLRNHSFGDNYIPYFVSTIKLKTHFL